MAVYDRTNGDKMKLNISQAAKVVGKARSTLYKHMASGKLTSEKDEFDNPVIDVSELQRVYPKLDMDALNETAGVVTDNVVKQQSETPSLHSKIQHLELQLQHAEEKLQISEERRREAEDREQKLLGVVEKQSLLLAAPKEDAAPVKKGFWQRLTGR